MVLLFLRQQRDYIRSATPSARRQPKSTPQRPRRRITKSLPKMLRHLQCRQTYVLGIAVMPASPPAHARGHEVLRMQQRRRRGEVVKARRSGAEEEAL